MYKIEKKEFGFMLTFGDFMQADEMKQWVEDSKKELMSAPDSFGVLIDMRTLKPLPDDAEALMHEGQKLYKEKGMAKSCVILNNPTTTMQFKRIAKETGIYAFERYVDASANEHWEKTAVDWLANDIDPDQ